MILHDWPLSVAELVEVLVGLPGTVAVALGGSRALDSHAPDSDWDLGLYYRGAIDLTALGHYGTVFPPGSWGRLMNGGAWLRRGGEKVDVILRDLDVVEYWTQRAERGEFERDALLGYVAGAPTYLLAAELASCRVLHGVLPSAPFPDQLAVSAPHVWRFCRSFSLDYARKHARRGNVIGAVGQVAEAIMQEAHAILCERREWVCNEKRLLEAAGLVHLHEALSQVPSEPARLVAWVDAIAAQLGVPLGEASPWA